MSRVTAGCIAAGTAVATAVLYRFDPTVTAWFPSCPLFAWTGWLCPGCGTLRALHALLHLRVAEAVHDNAFTLPVIVLMGGAALVRRPIGRHPARWLAAAAMFGVLRNIPLAAFTWLRP
jgi:hypothetical protein